jgi:hypothetical protein
MKALTTYVCIALLPLMFPQKLMAWATVYDNFFEIDADYGATYTSGQDGALNVTDGDSPDVHTADGRIQGTGIAIEHITVDGVGNYPYMGKEMLKFRCLSASSIDKDRSEIITMGGWDIDDVDDDRYFSFAFLVPSDTPTPAGSQWLMICQLHQCAPFAPPICLNWCKQGTISNRLVLQWKHYDASKNVITDVLDFNEEFEKDKWYHLLFQVKPDPYGQGFIKMYKMNEETGFWEPKVDVEDIAIGFYDGAQDEYEWKVGTYRGTSSSYWGTTRVYYDNVRYGRLWNNITKNKLTGYHKAILDLRFNEASGNSVLDSCYLFNGGSQGNPVYDYNNDGTLSGAARISGGVRGNADKCLYFDGNNDYVSVPLDTVDFDFGNYATFSCWFAASAAQTGKTLINQDLYSSGSNNWKIRLYFNAANKIDFCVRHPDGTTSQVRATGASSYCNGNWHHVVGTYNRFDTSGRIRIYIDGILANTATGVDEPILRGNIPLYIGKISSGTYYNGYIDEVMVFNYTMTADEVGDLYDSY